jgi:hypothetical protein
VNCTKDNMSHINDNIGNIILHSVEF